MSFQWQFVAAILYTEIAVALLLCVPVSISQFGDVWYFTFEDSFLRSWIFREIIFQIFSINFRQVHTFRSRDYTSRIKVQPYGIGFYVPFIQNFKIFFVQFISSKWWSAFFKSSLAKAVAARRLVHSICSEHMIKF